MSLAWYEYPFYWTGLTTPGMRFLGVFTLVNGVVLFAKPEISFTRRGDFKTWALESPNAPRGTTTWVPWWLPGLSLGVASAVFI